jgi:hypothetical protein
MSTELEPALSDLETKMAEAERQANGVLARLKRARKMAASSR